MNCPASEQYLIEKIALCNSVIQRTFANKRMASDSPDYKLLRFWQSAKEGFMTKLVTLREIEYERC